MENKHLDVYKELKSQLENGVLESKIQQALLCMVNTVLDENREKIDEPYGFTKKRILFLAEKIAYSEQDDNNKHKYISEKNFNNFI